jgi:hypothetical protein
METEDSRKGFFAFRPPDITTEVHTIGHGDLNIPLIQETVLPFRGLPLGTEHGTGVFIKSHCKPPQIENLAHPFL